MKLFIMITTAKTRVNKESHSDDYETICCVKWLSYYKYCMYCTTNNTNLTLLAARDVMSGPH